MGTNTVKSHVKPHFQKRIDAVLENETLSHSFQDAMAFLVDKRKTQLPDNDAFQKLQQQCTNIKQAAIQQLPEQLEQLEAQCKKNAIQVHWAIDAEEANQLILQIMQKENVKKVVKGKSMVSEEIHLNDALHHADIECIETDMGEYIVQLAKETPSHIIMPAIHKTKQDIARLFNEKIPNTPYTEEVDALIGIGRDVLRKKFEEADAGISGVNFAIAETGTLCLIENEGNGRMSTTAPRIHIALMGIEKVIPTLADLPPLLSLLPKSATGQAITTYVNMINSPRKENELDGPEQVHLVLIDNGRSQLYQDKTMQATLRCIRCGACMNHCPVYSRIGGHAYGTTYPGPIGQVIMPHLAPQKTEQMRTEQLELSDACSLNGACGESCPVSIPLPDLIRKNRQYKQQVNKHISTHWLWLLWHTLYSHPRIYRLASKIISKFRLLTPKKIGKWGIAHNTPIPAPKTLHQLMKAQHLIQEQRNDTE